MVMRTAANVGVWAYLNNNNDTAGPIKPIVCNMATEKAILASVRHNIYYHNDHIYLCS